MLALWSVKGGVGCTVTAAAMVIAIGRTRRSEGAVAVDLGGDLAPLLLDRPVDDPGVGEWLGSGSGVPADALARLELALPGAGVVLARGSGPLAEERLGVLAQILADDRRTVVADLGDLTVHHELTVVAAAAERSLLLVRACPLSLRRLDDLPLPPTGVVVVRERHRRADHREVTAAAGAPVVAELEVDPAVGAALDLGLTRRRLPRSFLRAVGALA